MAARALEGWPKKRILTEYLNTIYFGNGAYGVQQAALTYFHHGARDLTLPEAALLAGIPADPNRYDPVTNPTGRAAAARARAEGDARPVDDHAGAVREGERGQAAEAG